MARNVTTPLKRGLTVAEPKDVNECKFSTNINFLVKRRNSISNPTIRVDTIEEEDEEDDDNIKVKNHQKKVSQNILKHTKQVLKKNSMERELNMGKSDGYDWIQMIKIRLHKIGQNIF